MKKIGILTAGGDTPGLNAAIRGIGKSAIDLGIELVGFRQGFRGLMNNHTLPLNHETLSGILTLGGTILGTSRDKPHKMPVGGKKVDMNDRMVEVYQEQGLDALVCLGGGGTQRNALTLANKGLRVITLPKTIDNDISGTDISFGFDTALGIATDAIDRLHSTAHSHHRIIVVEVMGHRAGWLALGAGVAGGADVILIPEIPYRIDQIAAAIRKRSEQGKHFSIVAVAEGSMSLEDAEALSALNEALIHAERPNKIKDLKRKRKIFEAQLKNNTLSLAERLEALTGLEARVTILGHVQRGGTPSATDRLLATRLGTACTQAFIEGQSGVMLAVRGQDTVPVPLEEIAGIKRLVSPDDPLIISGRRVGTCFGNE